MYDKRIAEKRKEVQQQIEKLTELSDELQDLIEKNAVYKQREQHWNMTMGLMPTEQKTKH